jgi:putative SOS response-associated peptidase YedK
MCGRFALAFVRGFVTRFEIIDMKAKLEPRFNIAPTQQVPIVLAGSPNRAVMMRWGLVPFWAKSPKIGNRLINARAEGLTKRPAFRVSVKKKRCLVPATGFYEWKQVDGSKVPYHIRMKDVDFMAFAGLWDSWRDPQGTELMTFTIVTTAANSMLNKIHNRMPVILKREDEALWLENRQLDDGELKGLLKPYPARQMDAYEVSPAVNNPRNDGEDLIGPVHRSA